MDDLDWRWLRSFVAVADAGSMQEAAKASRISQPTLSRHIRQLEEAVGMTLFDRHARQMHLSEQGESLFERAMQVRHAVLAFERQAVGDSVEEEGPVRVTMEGLFGAYFAPGWLAELRQKHPGISIDLVIDDSEVNLLMREAEIAVRMFKPTQLDLVTRYIGQTQLGFFASADYVRRRGPIGTNLEDLIDHDLIGFDRVTAWVEHSKRMGYVFGREDFCCRTDTWSAHPHLAAAGLGIAVLPVTVGQMVGLDRVFPHVSIPGQPVWLTAHEDLHRNPRVGAVWRHLAETLQQLYPKASS